MFYLYYKIQLRKYFSVTLHQQQERILIETVI